MGDYFGHWLKLGAGADPAKLPRIFYVNWFRRDRAGKFVWPGYGENSRVLKWVVERLEGKAAAVDTPIGRLPARESLDVAGLDVSDAQLEILLTVDPEVWAEEAELIGPHYDVFGDRLPSELRRQEAALKDRLRAWSAPANDPAPHQDIEAPSPHMANA